MRTRARKKKSDAMRFMEKLTGGSVTFAKLMLSTRLCDEISQAEFARKLGISRSRLCDIEKGRRLVRPERAAMFARKLGYPEQYWVEIVLQDQLNASGLKFKITIEAA